MAYENTTTKAPGSDPVGPNVRGAKYPNIQAAAEAGKSAPVETAQVSEKNGKKKSLAQRLYPGMGDGDSY